MELLAGLSTAALGLRLELLLFLFLPCCLSEAVA